LIGRQGVIRVFLQTFPFILSEVSRMTVSTIINIFRPMNYRYCTNHQCPFLFFDIFFITCLEPFFLMTWWHQSVFWICLLFVWTLLICWRSRWLKYRV